MAIASLTESYKVLRRETAWTLLAADTAPETLALLQTLLFDNERRLTNSVFTDRLTRLLNETAVENVTREAAAARIVQWRQAGYVVRSLTDRDAEPVYELSVGAFEAIRFVTSQTVSRVAPTESRLELLIHAVKKLVDDTDENVKKRIVRLQADKKAIDDRIRALRDGRVATVSAVEIEAQIYDILAMIEALDGDFLRVRDAFHALAEKIHKDVMASDSTRGKILEQFFAGYDAIAESDEGRTFNAFYRFLSSELSTREIEELTDALVERPFWNEIDERRRDAITDIQTDLSHRARETQQVMKRLASSLRYFVQSREFQQNRRLATLLDDTRKASLAAAEVKAFGAYGDVMTLNQTFVSVLSVGDVSLYDPENAGDGETLTTAEVPVVDLAALAGRLTASEINYAWLRETIERCLKDRETVSIGDVMTRFPAKQGLASVVGYIHLAIQYAEAPKEGAFELLQWTNRFKETMRGRLPRYLFVRGCFQNRL